jgi:alpha-galactosidase
VATLECDPARARVYEFGWQSWSPAALYPVTVRSARPAGPLAQLMGYRPGRPPPKEGFQGEGLLAVEAGADGPVVIFAAPGPENVPSIRARLRGDRLEVSADDEVAVVAAAPGAALEEALGTWSDSFAADRRRAHRPLPPVWCSWYCLGSRVTAAAVLAAAGSARRRGVLCPVFQVDDGWQRATGDWQADRERFGDLAGLARQLRLEGRQLGIWVAPFVASEGSESFRRHPERYLRGADAGRNWGGRIMALDVTRPGALDQVTGQLEELASLGVTYFKLDFLYAGALEGERAEGLGGIAAYRLGMAAIRDSIGEAATIVACGAPLLPTVGLADAARVGPDTAPNWEPAGGDLSQPSGRSAHLVSRARAFTHGRWWSNDPDCLLARPGVECRGRRARQLGQLGRLASSGDLPEELDRWGLGATRRLMRPSDPGPTPPPGPLPVIGREPAP